jgi:hypothetical protein
MNKKLPAHNKPYLSYTILTIKALLVLLAVIFMVLNFSGQDSGESRRIGAVVFSFILPFATDILRLFRIKVPQNLELSYLIFLLFAQFLGIDFDLFRYVPNYDKLIHAVSGVLTFIVGLNIVDVCGITAKRYVNPRILMPIALTIVVAFLWECVEFTADTFFGMHMQTLISEGPADTMLDMISATVGAIIAAAVYAYTPVFKKS